MEDSLTATKEKKAPDLASLKRMYEESQTLTKDGRLRSQSDEDYYHGVQLTPAEKRVLRKRKQPENTWNFIRLWINGTLGVIKQGQTDPRAYPRNPQDEDSADVASKTLRFIADKSDFDALKIEAARDYLVPGTCAAIIEVDEDRVPVVTQIRWEEFFYDPRSRRDDFSDARFMGVAKWRWADEVAADYPKRKTDIEAAMDTGALVFDETQEDRPRDGSSTVAWVDRTKRRIMVVEMYHREGQNWRRCVFHAGGTLDYGPSEYLDDKKRPCCPIEAQSCYVDRENNRMGIARDMRGPQDEINKRSSKLLHELNTRQVQETSPGAGMGSVEEARAEAAKPDGAIPSGWQVVPRQDVVAGQEKLLQNAVAAGERFAPNPAILGRQGENQSGRASQIRQQAGMTEQAIIFGGIEDWEKRCYRQMWWRARQYMTAPDWVRVTDDEGSPEFIGINQPPTFKGPDGEPMMGEDGNPQVGKMLGDPSAQPGPDGTVPPMMRDNKPVFMMPDGSHALGYENNLAELDVDIVIDTVPDTANLQAEQFELLVKLAEMYGPQEVPFEDVLEASTLPNKRKVIEKRKTRQEDAQKQGEQSPQMQLQMQGAMTELVKLKAEVEKLQADTQLAQAKTRSEMAKPLIEAAKLEHSAMGHAADLDHEANFRGAELQQSDQQFQGQLNQQDEHARMQAAQAAQQAQQQQGPPA